MQARQAASDGTLWLLSSSQALDNLRAALPGQAWNQAHALATHPRIAQTARALGFASVHECRPALADVAASIESMP
jgi:uroporphyrinogen-III synthase